MNREEFTTQIKVHRESLRRFLVALCCGNTDEADDIAQESLVKAFLSSDKYTDTGRFASWIHRIAYRTFLDHNRSRSRMQPLEQVTEVCDSEHDADHAFHYQELYMALDGLGEKERTSLLLFYISGYDIKEIGRIMECSEDAVKKQLSRGREHLKKRMIR